MELSKETLEHLIARSSDIVVATDRKGTVVYFNDGAKRELGFRPEEILGRFVARLYPSLAEAKRVMAAMRAPSSGGRGIIENFRTTFRTRAGEPIPVAISGTLLFDDEGQEDGTIGFAKDLREILRKDKLATLAEVTVGVSHEISNPLEVILNQTELLERDVERMAGEEDVSVETERLDAIRREIARISEILERLGEMSRDETYETIDYIGPARMIDLRRRSPRPDEPQLRGLHILVADDDPGICRSLKEILEADGAAVETAEDGLEALRRLEASKFDLVLSDVVMPNMDGFELLCRVQEQHPDVPTLLMTAFHYDKDHIIKRSRLRGLSGVVFKKPVDPDALRQRILEATGRDKPAKT